MPQIRRESLTPCLCQRATPSEVMNKCVPFPVIGVAMKQQGCLGSALLGSAQLGSVRLGSAPHESCS